MADPSRTASVGDGLDGLKRVGLPASAHQRPCGTPPLPRTDACDTDGSSSMTATRSSGRPGATRSPRPMSPPLRRPARAPNLNAYTERFVRTIKDSCLERMVLIGEGSRRRAVREFVAHDHHERNHQGLDNRLILPLSRECPTGSRKSAATVNTSYPTFCISAMLSSSRSRCAFSIQRCS